MKILSERECIILMLATGINPRLIRGLFDAKDLCTCQPHGYCPRHRTMYGVPEIINLREP